MTISNQAAGGGDVLAIADLSPLYAASRGDVRTLHVLQSYAVARVARHFEVVTPSEAIRLSEALDLLLGD